MFETKALKEESERSGSIMTAKSVESARAWKGFQYVLVMRNFHKEEGSGVRELFKLQRIIPQTPL